MNKSIHTLVNYTYRFWKNRTRIIKHRSRIPRGTPEQSVEKNQWTVLEETGVRGRWLRNGNIAKTIFGAYTAKYCRWQRVASPSQPLSRARSNDFCFLRQLWLSFIAPHKVFPSNPVLLRSGIRAIPWWQGRSSHHVIFVPRRTFQGERRHQGSSVD